MRLPPRRAKWITLAKFRKMAAAGALRGGWVSIWGDIVVWGVLGGSSAVYAIALEEVCAALASEAGAIDGGTNPL